MWQKFIEWLEQHLRSCTYHKFMGLDCPGCGMQRAFIELLKGNIRESISIYPALIPMILLLGFLLLHLRFKFPKGSTILKVLFFTCVGIIIFSYIYKMTQLKS